MVGKSDMERSWEKLLHVLYSNVANNHSSLGGWLMAAAQKKEEEAAVGLMEWVGTFRPRQ